MPVLNKVSIWSLEYLFNDTASGKKHPKIASYKAKDSCIFWDLKLGWSILRYLGPLSSQTWPKKQTKTSSLQGGPKNQLKVQRNNTFK